MEEYTQRDIYAKRHTRWYIHMIGPIYGEDIHTEGPDGTYIQKRYIHSGNIHDETNIGWSVHMVEDTHGGVYTRWNVHTMECTYGGVYTR